MQYRVEPVLWDVIYPAQPHHPIGAIRRRRDGFHARLAQEHLGVYSTGDAAVEAIWGRYVEASYVRQEAASRVHGSHERG